VVAFAVVFGALPKAGAEAGAGLLAGAVAGADVDDVDVALGAGVALGAEVPVDLRDAELDAGAASAFAVSELSAAFAFFERLFFDLFFLAVLADSGGAAVSALAAVFVFDFAFELLPVVVVASAPLFVVSVVAGFFFAFFFVVVLLSLWSVEGAAPDCCAPRIADALPKTSNMAAIDARISPLLDLNKVFSLRCGC